MSYMKVENVVKQYGIGEAAFAAVKGISFGVERGDFTAIMGESGSGKSTLLSVMGALNTPTAGKYFVDGMDIFSLTQDQRAEFRRQFLGFVFQSFYLVPYLNVLQNVMVPLATTKIKGNAKQAMAEKALKRVGLDQKGHRLPSEISGGEQERVALARAIVNEPPILLADEPTGNLDTKTSLDIMNLFKTLNDDGMTVVMVTHSLECAKYARCTLNLSDGLLVGKNGRTRERTPHADKTTRLQRQAAA